MDTKFQTSFIPKKPITADSAMHAHSSSVNFFTFFAVLVFIISIAGAALSYFYISYLLNTQKQYIATLQANQNEFNPTLIKTLERANLKISFAKSLLATHLAPDAVFNIIGQLTAQNTSFNSLTYTAPADSNNFVTLTMSGVGTSFSAIAFQSDVFGSSVQYGENIALKDPVLSGLSLGPNGNVTFTFSTQLDPSNILYSKILAQSLGQTTAPVVPAVSAASSSTTPAR